MVEGPGLVNWDFSVFKSATWARSALFNFGRSRLKMGTSLSLGGLGEDKLASIRSYAQILARLDAVA